jgi:type I restriction enzyme, S subunit
MKEGWTQSTIGSLGMVQTGSTPKTSQKGNFGTFVPFVKPGDFAADGSLNYSNEGLSQTGVAGSRLIPQDSVLMVCIGATIGKVGFSEMDVCTNQQINALTPNDNVSHKFVYYQMLTPWFQRAVLQNSGQATLPIINKTKWSNLCVCLPPTLSEQGRIVSILDEAFSGITTAVAHAEQNLASARELFENHLNAVFTQKGNGWVEKTLGEIADFKNGLNFTKRSKGERVKIVGVKDFKSNFWVPMDKLDTVQVESVLNDAYALKKNDIVTVRSNGNKQLIGRCILADDVPEKVSHSGFTIRIRVHSPDVKSRYLVHYLKSGIVHEMLVKSGGGTNISSLNQTALSSLPVRLPKKEEQSQIVSGIETLKADSQRLETLYQQKLDALAELKQSILQQAFLGQLTVDNG